MTPLSSPGQLVCIAGAIILVFLTVVILWSALILAGRADDRMGRG